MKKNRRRPKCQGTDIAHTDTGLDKNALGESQIPAKLSPSTEGIL